MNKKGENNARCKKLSGDKGKRQFFFSYPADFTAVCTSEFITLAKHDEEFLLQNRSVIYCHQHNTKFALVFTRASSHYLLDETL